MKIVLTEAQVKKMIKGLHNEWKEVDGKLIRIYDFPTYKDTVNFVNKVFDIAQEQDHHPEMVIGYDTVKVIMYDHEEGGISDKCHKFTNAVDDMVSKEESLDELSRSFAFTRKKRLFSEPAKKYAKNRFRFADRELEEQGWTDPVKAASGPQKCGLTKGQGGDNYDKESRALDKEAARQDKLDAKQREMENKNFLSLSHDRDSYPLDKQTRKLYFTQYQEFMNSNPGVLTDGDGYNSQQKYAAVSKALDFVKRVPQISYSKNLRTAFGLNPQSTIMDVVNVVDKMGGWASFINWFNSGGPQIKK